MPELNRELAVGQLWRFKSPNYDQDWRITSITGNSCSVILVDDRGDRKGGVDIGHITNNYMIYHFNGSGFWIFIEEKSEQAKDFYERIR